MAIAAIFFVGCTKREHAADLIVIGKIWTGDDHLPYAEAMAIVADTIAAVGNEEQIRKWAGDSTRVIETEDGMLVVPGFIDCHVHFIDGGFALSSVQLRDAQTPADFIDRIARYARTIPAGTWITNGDWDHENWGGELPTRAWIDSVTGDHPVWINRLDGHMALANSKALELASITDRVKDVDGGTIARDRRGRITGIFKDNAMRLVSSAIPDPSEEQEDRALISAMDYVASHGVTSVHHVGGSYEIFERALREEKLKTRVYVVMPLTRWASLNEHIKMRGRGDKWLRVGGLKAFVDGSLGSHTAAFFEPFTDSPDDSGFFVTDETLLYRRIRSADSLGLQPMVHAIGDRAIHTLLNIFERVAHENGVRDRRFRIEHAQHIHPDDIARFEQLKVIASMQPYHAIDDGRWAEKVIGHERSKTTYAFHSLINAKATVAFGSDWFVAPPVPLYGIYAAVTRRTLDENHPDGWMPEQKITVHEALKCYTINAAYASFEEDIKGSLTRGKLADFIILGKDITTIAPEEIRDVRVLRTFTGGVEVFSRDRLDP